MYRSFWAVVSLQRNWLVKFELEQLIALLIKEIYLPVINIAPFVAFLFTVIRMLSSGLGMYAVGSC